MSTNTKITVSDNKPVTKYTVEGTGKFTTGVDNIDDKYKISTGSNLDSPAFEIDNNGNIVINNDLTVHGTRHISNSSALLAEDSSINLGLIDSNPISGINESANNSGYYIINTENDISSGITVGTDNLVIADVVLTSSGGSTGDRNSDINKTHPAANCDNSFTLGDFTTTSSSFSSSDSNFTNNYSAVSGSKIKLNASTLPNLRTTLSSYTDSSSTTLPLTNINGFQPTANGNSSTDTSTVYIYESAGTTDTVISKTGTTDKIIEKTSTTDTFHGATSTSDTVYGATNTTNNIIEKSGTTDSAHAVDTSVTNTIIELTTTTDTMYAVNSSVNNTIVEKTSTTNNIVEKSGTSDSFYPVDSSVSHQIVEKTSTTNNVIGDSGTSTTLTSAITDSSTNSITISVNSVTNLSVNDYLLIDEEIGKITAISGTDVTITREQFSTSMATHTNGTTVTKVSDLGTGTTTIYLTSNTNASSFYNGSSKYAMIGSEVIQVTARNSNQLTINRGNFTTTGSTHAINSQITLLEDNITSDSLSILTLLTSSDISTLYSDGDKIIIDNEVMTISAGGVDNTEKTLTVSRSSPSTHNIGYYITKVTTDSGSNSYFILVGGNFSSFTSGKYIYIGTEVIKVDSVSTVNGQNMITLVNSGGTRTPQYSTSSSSISEATAGFLLRDSITNNGTSLTLLNSTNLTSFYNGSSKYAIISSEVVQITGRTNNDITLVRNRLSTSPSTYSNNDGITLLEDNITSGGTTFTLLSSENASSFDDSSIVIDNEIMTIGSGGVSGTTLTVTRGQSSTTATTHTIGNTITKLETDSDGTHQNFALVGGNFSSYTQNKYIYVGSEVVRVSSVSSTSGQNMITINRGQLSTTAVAISNGTSNTLVEDNITSGGTSLTLLSSGNAASFDNSSIVIDNEIMTIGSGGVSGTTITVTRGQSSTTATTHTIGKTITKLTTDSDGTHQNFALVGGNFSDYTQNKYIYVGSEVTRVNSVSSTSGQNVITINRSQLSTTATAISNGTTMYLLNDNISSGGTSLTVLSSGNASSFNGNSLIVDNEIMTVSGVSGVTLTVSRGQLSSGSATHNINSKITLLSALTDSSSNTYIALYGNDYDNMKTVGNKILIENEIVEVTANSSDSQVLTISRGANSTTVSSHNQGLIATLLTSNISNDNTFLALTGGNYTSFNNGNYFLIGTEIIYVNSRSNNVLEVNRGQETTSASSYSNGVSGTLLVSPISSNGTTLDTLSGNITSTGDILINEEVLTVTNVSGTTLTVTRGVGDSSASTHSLGSTVTSLNSMSSSTTSLDLNNGSSASNFSSGKKVLIGNEILNIVSRSDSTLTVTRGQYGTVAQAIISGTTITLLKSESVTISSTDIYNNQVTISSGLSNSYNSGAIIIRKLTTSDHFYLSSVSSNTALSFTYNLDGLNTSGDYLSLDPNYSETLSIIGINFLTINIGQNNCTATVTNAFIGKSTTNTSKGTFGINFNYYANTNTDKSKAIRLDSDSGGTGGSLLFSDTVSDSLVDYFKFDFNNKRSLQYYDSSNYLTTTVDSAGSSTLATTGTTGNLTLDIAGDLYLNADGGDVFLQDGATSFLQFTNNGSGGVTMSNTTGDFIFSSSTSEKPVIEILNTNADGNSSEIKFNKTSASEANGDVLGEMTFYGYDNANNSTKYVSLESKSKTITDGSEDGSLLLNAFSNGTNKQFIDFNETASDTVTVGTTSQNITLDVKGAIFSASDKRLKENIIPIENPLNYLTQLNGVSFNFISNHNDKHYGLIAQDVERILPDIVTNDKDGYKSVNYQNTIPFLIEGIKDLQKEIEEIKKKI